MADLRRATDSDPVESWRDPTPQVPRGPRSPWPDSRPCPRPGWKSVMAAATVLRLQTHGSGEAAATQAEGRHHRRAASGNQGQRDLGGGHAQPQQPDVSTRVAAPSGRAIGILVGRAHRPRHVPPGRGSRPRRRRWSSARTSKWWRGLVGRDRASSVAGGEILSPATWALELTRCASYTRKRTFPPTRRTGRPIQSGQPAARIALLRPVASEPPETVADDDEDKRWRRGARDVEFEKVAGARALATTLRQSTPAGVGAVSSTAKDAAARNSKPGQNLHDQGEHEKSDHSRLPIACASRSYSSSLCRGPAPRDGLGAHVRGSGDGRPAPLSQYGVQLGPEQQGQT